MILSINKQSLLLEFAGAKSCSKWVNSNENDWLLGAGCNYDIQGSAKKRMGNWCAPCVHGKLVLQE